MQGTEIDNCVLLCVISTLQLWHPYAADIAISCLRLITQQITQTYNLLRTTVY